MTRSKTRKAADALLRQQQRQKHQPQQQQQQQHPHQQEEDPNRLKKDIRKDMQTTLASRGYIDKDFMMSKYLAKYPQKADRVRDLVTSYYAEAVKENEARGAPNWEKPGKRQIDPPKEPSIFSKSTKDKKSGAAKGNEHTRSFPISEPEPAETDPWKIYDQQAAAKWKEAILLKQSMEKKDSKKSNESKEIEQESKDEEQDDLAQSTTNHQQNGWAVHEESISIPKEPKGKKSRKSAPEPIEQDAGLVQSTDYQQNGFGLEESFPKESTGKKPKKSKESKKIEPEPQNEEHADLVQSTNAILNEFKEHLATQRLNLEENNSLKSTKTPDLERQLQFLSISDDSGSSQNEDRNIENAVLVSPILEDIGNQMPSQFGLLGHLASRQSQDLMDPRVMLNTNIPFSAFICGLQGSGKSHTTSCMIENCSLPFPTLGVLKKPLSTLVLHYNEYSSNVSNQPSEAAFLASTMPQFGGNYKKTIPVRVLTSPSNFHNLEKMYSQIPSVSVHPFRLQPRHLNIATMLSLMSMGKKDSRPLYMSQLTRVLREMALTNQGRFNYFEFRKRLKDLHLDRSQTPFLEQRLDLLDSFLDLKGSDRSGGDYFVDGGVTILDLSCPFMDQDTACILFRIAIDLFLHAHPSRGKLIVADEAHKYMTNTEAANALTETFLNIIRQQRHLGTRIIISTQEPTVSPRLIDLCSITIVHRFSSPEWYQTIKKHIAIGDSKKKKKKKKNGNEDDYDDDNNNDDDDDDAVDGLYQISSLRTGEALVFAPSAYLLDGHQEVMDVKDKTFKMVIRKRVTWDGGQTIKVVR